MIIDSFKGDYRFLSNFYLAQITYKGRTFKSTEHFYQACKTLDKKEQARILAAKTPGDARKIGNDPSQTTVREGWDEIKYRVMWIALNLKFTQNNGLRQKLLDTGDAYLIEQNYWHDCDFGSCTCQACSNRVKKNALGKLLMLLRNKLRIK